MEKSSWKEKPLVVLVVGLLVGIILTAVVYWVIIGDESETKWTEDFNIGSRTFASNGSNDFYILEPGYRLVLEGLEDGEDLKLQITVLNDTKVVDGVETRIVEEREWENGELIEVSRNYFAFCIETKSVFYFGEEVDDYKNGEIVGHGGEWEAGKDGAKAGLMMPGLVLLGSAYYQEVAPDVAMDRAVHISTDATQETPAGNYVNCLKVEESTPLEKGVKEYKIYAPGVGLVKDGDALLVSYGYV